MHVGLITYQTGHLKTKQLALMLKEKKHEVTLFAFPFKYRKQSPQKTKRFQDRPDQLINEDMKLFCQKNNFGWQEVQGWTPEYSQALDWPNDDNKPDIYITCIAKIIPQSFLENRHILNCHPGLLPQNRGVDAFKWCIVNSWPIGVTLHIIDENIDQGLILCRKRVPINQDDTLQSVCARLYDIELELAANFEKFLPYKKFNWVVQDSYECSHKQIPEDWDEKIEETFLQNIDTFKRLATDLDAQPHASDKEVKELT